MLKSLALKILEDLGEPFSNIIVFFRKKTPKVTGTVVLQNPCQQLRKDHSEGVTRVETENFVHKMGPTNREVGHNTRCRPGLHQRKRTRVDTQSTDRLKEHKP